MPTGYYVDLTQLAIDYGWERVAAGSDWRRNFNSTNYWLFQRRDNLSWYEAMRELYTEAQLGGFAPRAVSPSAPQPDPLALTNPAPTLAPPVPTVVDTEVATEESE